MTAATPDKTIPQARSASVSEIVQSRDIGMTHPVVARREAARRVDSRRVCAYLSHKPRIFAENVSAHHDALLDGFRLAPAVVFYFVYGVGLVIFAVRPGLAADSTRMARRS